MVNDGWFGILGIPSRNSPHPAPNQQLTIRWLGFVALVIFTDSTIGTHVNPSCLRVMTSYDIYIWGA